MKAKENRPVKKVHLTNFHIAGFGFWDGPEAFEQLKIGTRLDLVREPDNKFDAYAVAIYHGDFKLGFIPRGENHDISKYLDIPRFSIFCTKKSVSQPWALRDGRDDAWSA